MYEEQRQAVSGFAFVALVHSVCGLHMVQIEAEIEFEGPSAAVSGAVADSKLVS